LEKYKRGKLPYPSNYMQNLFNAFISRGFYSTQSGSYFTVMVGTVTVVSPQVMEVDLISGSSLTPIL